MSKRGFTLIELLLVIAIIGVLASIVIVAVAGVRDSAKQSKAKADINQLLKAAEIVYQTYGYYPNDSHSDVICPKDIEIAPGRTWGDFINVCEDPWGDAYEWNNVCTNGHARSSHVFDVTCPWFSDNGAGPVGVRYNGKNGIDDGCSGDDICLGDRGHAVYGYASDSSGGGSGALCINITSTCSGLSVFGCESRAGCGVLPTSCNGTYSGSGDCTAVSFNSCGTGQYVECVPQSGGSCSGTPTSCSTLVQTQCNTVESAGGGCSWSTGGCSGSVNCSIYSSNLTTCSEAGCAPISASCNGTFNCNQFTNQSACQSFSCTWKTQGGGSCQAANKSCGTLSQSTCTPTGCGWNPGSCGGSSSCSVFSLGQCTYSGCTPVSSSCNGSANCDYSQTNCTAAIDPGCSWANTSSCTGTYTTNINCDAFTDSTSCGGQPTCSWSGGQCSGTAVSCTTFDQSQCNTQAGCSWQ